MAHFLDKDGLQRFFNGLKNVFALKDHSHTTVNGHTVNADVPSGAKFTDTTYSSKAAASGGTAVSLVTTGEKYTWNSKTNTRVKGNAESSYRTGDVNLTAANIGAAAATHSHAASDITSGTVAAARLPKFTPPRHSSSGDTEGVSGIVTPPSSLTEATAGYYLAGDGTWQRDDDERVRVALDTTTKAYLLATTTAPVAGSTAQHTAVADTGVYLDTTAGRLTAGSFSGNGANLTNLNASNIASGTVPAARLPFVKDGWIDFGTISSLPVTKTASYVTTDMVCCKMELSNPAAQRDTWAVNTDTAGKITISGTIEGTTTVKLKLDQVYSATAT